MKLLIATDAWSPQVNGVVRTYQNVISILESKNCEITVLHPYCEGFRRNCMRAYPEIEYVTNPKAVWRYLEEHITSNIKIHIATEGPIGVTTRWFCARNNLPFTSCFHTQFPEFIQSRWYVPTVLTYPYFRWFHNRARKVFCPTVGMQAHLKKNGICNTEIWTRGVDGTLFNPDKKTESGGYALCVSRVSKEKGLDDFCRLNYPKKVLVGDGPYLESLKRKYPDVIFVGKQQGLSLATWYANADLFVFPSKTDTFGIVLLEAIASGIPIAAYPEPGPLEVIQVGINGWYHDDLQWAVNSCKTIDRAQIRATAESWTWQYSAQQFLNNLI